MSSLLYVQTYCTLPYLGIPKVDKRIEESTYLPTSYLKASCEFYVLYTKES